MERLEDSATGRILPKQFHVAIPKQRQDQAKVCAKVLGPSLWQRFPWVKGTKAMGKELQELVLNRTWRPFVELIGADGIPNVDKAGNVLRPFSTFKLSLRIPPRADAAACLAHLKKVMTEQPPSGAKITFSAEKASTGWDAPPLAGWLEEAPVPRRRRRRSASPASTWAKAARSRSWACSARSSPRRSS